MTPELRPPDEEIEALIEWHDRKATDAQRVLDAWNRQNREGAIPSRGAKFHTSAAAALRSLSARNRALGEADAYDLTRPVNRYLGFSQSVIKSGEPWTASCQEAYRSACEAVDAIHRALTRTALSEQTTKPVETTK